MTGVQTCALPISGPSATQLYGAFAYLIPLAPLAPLLLLRDQRRREPALLLALWCGALGALALQQVRFGADFSVPGSVAFALLLSRLGGELQARARLARPAASAVAVLVGGALIWPAVGGVHLPKLRPFLANLGLWQQSAAPEHLSPKLSLQLFAQPLVSTGEYQSYRQLAASGTFDFIEFEEVAATETAEGVFCGSGSTCVLDGERYMDFTGDGLADDSFEDRDFNIRSLRGSAVLRWEYRPGSVFFLVWQQARREELDDGDFRLGRDLGSIFSTPGEDTFIAKASFYVDF